MSCGYRDLTLHEPRPESVGCGRVRGAGCLRVDGQSEPRIGVSEPGLGGLQVDSFKHHAGGVCPTEVVELKTFEVHGDGRAVPHTPAEVGVVEDPALGGGEDELVAVGPTEPPGGPDGRRGGP